MSELGKLRAFFLKRSFPRDVHSFLIVDHIVATVSGAQNELYQPHERGVANTSKQGKSQRFKWRSGNGSDDEPAQEKFGVVLSLMNVGKQQFQRFPAGMCGKLAT